jgi:hypothetical protein
LGAAITTSPFMSLANSGPPAGRSATGTEPETALLDDDIVQFEPVHEGVTLICRRCTSRLSPSLACFAVETRQYPYAPI